MMSAFSVGVKLRISEKTSLTELPHSSAPRS
jgi:hypothetical protein